MKSKIIYLNLVLGFFCIAFSGCKSESTSETKLDSTSRSVINDFFRKMEANNYKTALDDLLQSNENIDLKDSSTILLKQRFDEINKFSGAYKGSSLLKKRIINSDIAVYSYLTKYDKKFYRFIFFFYNNGTETKIYKFMFNDTIEIEIEESLKLYI